MMRVATCLCLLVVAACGATSERPDVRHAEPRPWTRAFLQPAVLIADEVEIRGPAGLLDHFASRQDPATTVYTTRTTEEGLLQETVARPGAGGIEIPAQLDALEIIALRRLVVLEHVGDVELVVRATGNAYWASATGGGERRDHTITLRGGPPVSGASGDGALPSGALARGGAK